MSDGIDHGMSQAVRAAYGRGQEEEKMEPLVRVDQAGQPIGRIRDGDFVIFYDIRGEREVELTQAFVEPGFNRFPIDPDLRTHWATMIEYDPSLSVSVAFPPFERLSGTLSETISQAGLIQHKVTETEKAIHLGYFFNGKRKEPFHGERRVTPPSPKDPYHQPEMRAADVGEGLIAAVQDPKVAFITGNFPNVDVVGHNENKAAIIRAVETVDDELGRVLAAAEKAGVTAIVTADHGTVESWLYPEGTIDTGHTKSPVPMAVVFPPGVSVPVGGLRGGGSLIDIGPTVLELMGLEVPREMTGRSLFEGPLPAAKRRVMLVVCDGWGCAEPGPGNLISQSSTPTMDRLMAGRFATQLAAAEEAVGLPAGTVGNSEAGHLHIGAGRIIPADRVRIQQAIEDGSFFENEAFSFAMEGAVHERTRLHLVGIVSFFSSHGSLDHLFALLEMARRVGISDVFIHGLLGRRGERPESGAYYVEMVEDETARLGVGQLVSLIGRYWALDREQNWDRVQRTYRLLVEGVGWPVD